MATIFDECLKTTTHTVPVPMKVITWNANGRIDTLSEIRDKLIFPAYYDDAVPLPRIVVLGLQEMIELSATNVLENSMGRFPAAMERFNLWRSLVLEVLQERDLTFRFIGGDSLVGVALLVFADEALTHTIRNIQVEHLARGVGGVLGNKGAVYLRMDLLDTSLCFVVAHFAAHREKVKKRNEDFHAILHHPVFSDPMDVVAQSSRPSSATVNNVESKLRNDVERLRRRLSNVLEKQQQTPQASFRYSANYKGGAIGGSHSHSMTAYSSSAYMLEKEKEKDKDKPRQFSANDHDIIIWLGDLNYRIVSSMETGTVYDLIHNNKLMLLAAYDQLCQERERGHVFEGFCEGSLTFPPTYQYIPGTDLYDDRKDKKMRCPAWCDRILWRVKGEEYLEEDVETGMLKAPSSATGLDPEDADDIGNEEPLVFFSGANGSSLSSILVTADGGPLTSKNEDGNPERRWSLQRDPTIRLDSTAVYDSDEDDDDEAVLAAPLSSDPVIIPVDTSTESREVALLPTAKEAVEEGLPAQQSATNTPVVADQVVDDQSAVSPAVHVATISIPPTVPEEVDEEEPEAVTHTVIAQRLFTRASMRFRTSCEALEALSAPSPSPSHTSSTGSRLDSHRLSRRVSLRSTSSTSSASFHPTSSLESATEGDADGGIQVQQQSPSRTLSMRRRSLSKIRRTSLRRSKRFEADQVANVLSSSSFINLAAVKEQNATDDNATDNGTLAAVETNVATQASSSRSTSRDPTPPPRAHDRRLPPSPVPTAPPTEPHLRPLPDPHNHTECLEQSEHQPAVSRTASGVTFAPEVVLAPPNSLQDVHVIKQSLKPEMGEASEEEDEDEDEEEEDEGSAVHLLSYHFCANNISDHKPVAADIVLRARSVDQARHHALLVERYRPVLDTTVPSQHIWQHPQLFNRTWHHWLVRYNSDQTAQSDQIQHPKHLHPSSVHANSPHHHRHMTSSSVSSPSSSFISNTSRHSRLGHMRRSGSLLHRTNSSTNPLLQGLHQPTSSSKPTSPSRRIISSSSSAATLLVSPPHPLVSNPYLTSHAVQLNSVTAAGVTCQITLTNDSPQVAAVFRLVSPWPAGAHQMKKSAADSKASSISNADNSHHNNSSITTVPWLKVTPQRAVIAPLQQLVLTLTVDHALCTEQLALNVQTYHEYSPESLRSLGRYLQLPPNDPLMQVCTLIQATLTWTALPSPPPLPPALSLSASASALSADIDRTIEAVVANCSSSESDVEVYVVGEQSHRHLASGEDRSPDQDSDRIEEQGNDAEGEAKEQQKNYVRSVLQGAVRGEKVQEHRRRQQLEAQQSVDDPHKDDGASDSDKADPKSYSSATSAASSSSSVILATGIVSNPGGSRGQHSASLSRLFDNDCSASSGPPKTPSATHSNSTQNQSTASSSIQTLTRQVRIPVVCSLAIPMDL